MKKELLYILVLGVFAMVACEDLVDVDVDEAPDQIVVDAWLDDLSQPQTVRLTKSQTFFQNTAAQGITGAIVQVRDDKGNSFDFMDNGNGDYVWTPAINENLGEVATVFTLDVLVQTKSITSVTTLLPAPVIDSISQEFKENELIWDDGIYCEFFSRDFQGKGNTYWIKSYKNGLFLNRPIEINIAYDAGFDSGSEVDGLIFIPPIREFVNEQDDESLPVPWIQGDQIKVEIHSISTEAFAWIEIARNQMINGFNGIFAEPIANAKGNIINNTDDAEVLGVFNVASVSVLEAIIE